MSEAILKGACIIGQSGGPSAVINASAYGVIKTALESDAYFNFMKGNEGMECGNYVTQFIKW